MNVRDLLMEKKDHNLKTGKKSMNIFRLYPWRSLIAGLLVLIILITTIGSQIAQVTLSSDNYKNTLQKRAVSYLTEANEYANQGKFDRAIESIKLFLNLYPENEEGYLMRASIYTSKMEYKKAIADFNHLLELNPNNADYYLQRGCLYILLDDYDHAQTDFNKAIQKDNADPELLLLIAQIYCEKKDYDAAINIYDQYLADYPDSDEIYAQEAYLYSLTEDYDNAVKMLQRAYDIAPSYKYSAALAQTYAALGSYEETITYCNLALAENNSDKSLYKLLADTYYLMENYESALENYTIYLSSSPKDEEAAYQQCVCYLQLNQTDEALRAGQELLSYVTDETIRNNIQNIVNYLTGE